MEAKIQQILVRLEGPSEVGCEESWLAAGWLADWMSEGGAGRAEHDRHSTTDGVHDERTPQMGLVKLAGKRPFSFEDSLTPHNQPSSCQTRSQ